MQEIIVKKPVSCKDQEIVNACAQVFSEIKKEADDLLENLACPCIEFGAEDIHVGASCGNNISFTKVQR